MQNRSRAPERCGCLHELLLGNKELDCCSLHTAAACMQQFLREHLLVCKSASKVLNPKRNHGAGRGCVRAWAAGPAALKLHLATTPCNWGGDYCGRAAHAAGMALRLMHEIPSRRHTACRFPNILLDGAPWRC